MTWTCRRCGTSFDAAGQPDAGLVGQVLLRSLGDGATVILEPEAGERDEVETILDEAGMLGSTPAARERLVGLGLAACADPDRSGADHLALPPACPVCHGRRMAVVRPWEDVVDDDVPVAARTRWHRLHRSGRSRLVLQVVAASLAALE